MFHSDPEPTTHMFSRLTCRVRFCCGLGHRPPCRRRRRRLQLRCGRRGRRPNCCCSTLPKSAPTPTFVLKHKHGHRSSKTHRKLIFRVKVGILFSIRALLQRISADLLRKCQFLTYKLVAHKENQQSALELHSSSATS